VQTPKIDAIPATDTSYSAAEGDALPAVRAHARTHRFADSAVLARWAAGLVTLLALLFPTSSAAGVLGIEFDEDDCIEKYSDKMRWSKQRRLMTDACTSSTGMVLGRKKGLPNASSIQFSRFPTTRMVGEFCNLVRRKRETRLRFGVSQADFQGSLIKLRL
jgi:hypothetical protein